MSHASKLSSKVGQHVSSRAITCHHHRTHRFHLFLSTYWLVDRILLIDYDHPQYIGLYDLRTNHQPTRVLKCCEHPSHDITFPWGLPLVIPGHPYEGPLLHSPCRCAPAQWLPDVRQPQLSNGTSSSIRWIRLDSVSISIWGAPSMGLSQKWLVYHGKSMKIPI